MPFVPAPRTLQQVGSYVLDGMPYSSAMKEFLDQVLWSLQRQGACRDEPLPIDPDMIDEAPPVLGIPVLDVHICGMGEHLAILGGFPSPKWTEREEGFLAKPVILRYGGRGGETSAPFARRGLLCGPSLQKMWAVLPERNCATSRCTI